MGAIDYLIYGDGMNFVCELYIYWMNFIYTQFCTVINNGNPLLKWLIEIFND